MDRITDRSSAWNPALEKLFPAVVVGVASQHLLCQSFLMELLAVFLDKINMQRK